jgi:hypothetical protein
MLPTKKLQIWECPAAVWAEWEWECNLILDFRFAIFDWSLSKDSLINPKFEITNSKSKKAFVQFGQKPFVSLKLN